MSLPEKLPITLSRNPTPKHTATALTNHTVAVLTSYDYLPQHAHDVVGLEPLVAALLLLAVSGYK